MSPDATVPGPRPDPSPAPSTFAPVAGSGALVFFAGMMLDPTDAVPRAVQALLLLLALALPVVYSRMPVRRLARQLLGGALLGGVAYLLVVGPGNLWPIALVYFAIAIAPPVAIGAVAAWLVRRLLAARAGRAVPKAG